MLRRKEMRSEINRDLWLAAQRSHHGEITKMGKYSEDGAKPQREILQLKRLETLTDVVYGIVIWNFFTLIPGPDGEWPWDSIGAFLTSNLLTFALVIVGVVVSIIYWIQNNALFGNLERTDARHTALSIFQLFFLLIFLYSIHRGVALGAGRVLYR